MAPSGFTGVLLCFFPATLGMLERLAQRTIAKKASHFN
jgi:hypothetical protein